MPITENDVKREWIKVRRKIVFSLSRRSHTRCSIKKAVLKNFAILTRKHLCWNLFFNKVAANFIKKRLQHRCFSVNIAKSLRALFLKNICEQLLLIDRISVNSYFWLTEHVNCHVKGKTEKRWFHFFPLYAFPVHKILVHLVVLMTLSNK